MNYQRTKPASKHALKIIISAAVILILLRLVVPHAFGAFFEDVFSPLWRFSSLAARSSAPQNGIVFGPDSPFASTTIAELMEENGDLKDMLGRPAAADAVLATVLSKPPFSAYDSLIVDVGSEQGIQTGDTVYALAEPVTYSISDDVPPSASTTSDAAGSLLSASSSVSSVPSVPSASPVQSSTSTASSSASAAANASSTAPASRIEIPIGQVAETYGDTSVVTLFSSPGQKYAVEIGAYRVAATAVADGAGMFEAKVPDNSNIMIGDPVVVPGIQTGVFASVVSVVSDPALPYSVVLFQSPVDPFSLYYVSIGLGGKK